MLLITDLLMPDTDGDTDGIETIYQFRRDFPDVKIIATSGGGSREWVERLTVARRMDAQRAFTKPCAWADIAAATQEIAQEIVPLAPAS
jgi:DNA-binding NarL/FixJ family response regulator